MQRAKNLAQTRINLAETNQNLAEINKNLAETSKPGKAQKKNRHQHDGPRFYTHLNK
ncbi:MAG: hypothetical protein ABS939_09450 [Psychrobacillus sp.]